jgi:hypothetical protein
MIREDLIVERIRRPRTSGSPGGSISCSPSRRTLRAGPEEYGESRLRDLLATSRVGSPDGIRDPILASASAFAGVTPLRDDLTLVVAKLA